jgi:PTS system cellobiose-specific IIC component
VRERLQALGDALSKQPHLQAVRDGVVGSLPLILLGSLFLLFAQPPWPALARFFPPIDVLRAGSLACAGLVSIYACAATALSLARRREVDPVAGATTGLAVFLIAQHPVLVPGTPALRMLPVSTLGAEGLFPSFAAAIFAVEMLHFFVRKKWGIRLSNGPPDVVVRSFAALLPTATCVLTVWLLVHVLGIDLIGGIGALFRPLLIGGNSLPAVLVVVLIDSGLWMVGVHGLSVLAAVKPLWLASLVQNMAAVSAGQPPQNVFTQEFFIWFTWQGGSGVTLALAILMIFTKSKQLKLVGKTAIIPALFNINEPLLFGTPVVLNAKLAPPFVATPVLLVTITWTAMHFGFVHPPYLEVPWTLPAPFGAFLSTGGDIRAVALQMVNLMVALLCWWPFVRKYDRALLEAEAKAEREPLPPVGEKV